MFYQHNPVFAGGLVIVFIGIFLFFKLRKNSRGSGSLSFFSGRTPPHNSTSEDWMLFLMAQQFIDPSPLLAISKNKPLSSELNERQDYIEQVKEKVLELLSR
jgi:hypothetical protein